MRHEIRAGWEAVNFWVLLIITISVLTPGSSAAFPRYSATYGQSCTLCHVNPTGGGMRSAYATEYIIPQELAMNPPSGQPLAAEIAPGIRLGGDVRSLVMQGDDGRNEMILMQSDVYLAVTLDPTVSAFIEQGRFGVGEAYGLARVLPAGGYLKVGQFMPAYGWRFADHQLPGRRFLLYPEGNDRPSQLLDEGMEMGLRPGPFFLQAAMLAGEADNGESYAGRLAWRRSAGDLNLVLGGSVWRIQGLETYRRAAGVFGAAALGPFSWVWQLDETSDSLDKGLLATHQVAVRLRQGLDLLATYGFQDPDRNLVSGKREQYGLGLDSLVSPAFGALILVRHYRPTQGADVADEEGTVGQLVLHVLF